MLYFDVPDETLSQAVVRNGVPTVLVAEPFEQAVLYSMQARSFSFDEAVRFVTQSVSALFPIASSETIAPLKLGSHLNELESLVNRISLSLGFSLSASNIHNILSLYRQGENAQKSLSEIVLQRIEHTADARTRARELKREDIEALRSVAAGYNLFMGGRRPPRLTWPVSMCLNGEKPHQGVKGPIDLTGPARVLTFGPYLHLPVGRWRAELTFAVRDNHSGNSIMIDAIADGARAAVGRAELPTSGNFVTSLDFQVKKPQDPIEIRTFIGIGAIEGEIELIDLTIVSRNGS